MADDIFPPGTLQQTYHTREGRALIPDLIKPGDTASEYTITIQDPRFNNNRWTNIPTIYNGKVISDEEAKNRVAEAKGRDSETGKVLASFDSKEEAESAADERSIKIGQQMYQPKPSILRPGDLPPFPGEERPEQTQGMLQRSDLPSLEETNIHDIYPPEETEVPEPTDTPTPDPAESQGLLQQFLQNPNIQRALTTGLAGLGAGPYGAIEAGKQFDVRAKTKLEQEERKQEKAYKEREFELKEKAANLAAEKDKRAQATYFRDSINMATDLRGDGATATELIGLLGSEMIQHLPMILRIGADKRKEKKEDQWHLDLNTNEPTQESGPNTLGPQSSKETFDMSQKLKKGDPKSPVFTMVNELNSINQAIEENKHGSFDDLYPLIQAQYFIKRELMHRSQSPFMKALGELPDKERMGHIRNYVIKQSTFPEQRLSLNIPDGRGGIYQAEGPARIVLQGYDTLTKRQNMDRLSNVEDIFYTLERMQPLLHPGAVGPTGTLKSFLQSSIEQIPEMFKAFVEAAGLLDIDVLRDIKTRGIEITQEQLAGLADDANRFESLITSLAYKVAKSRESTGRLSIEDVAHARRSITGPGLWEGAQAIRGGLHEVFAEAKHKYIQIGGASQMTKEDIEAGITKWKIEPFISEPEGPSGVDPNVVPSAVIEAQIQEEQEQIDAARNIYIAINDDENATEAQKNAAHKVFMDKIEALRANRQQNR
jgi:hypothetical protein